MHTRRPPFALLSLLVGPFYPAAVTLLTFDATRLLGPNITAALGNLAPVVAVAAGIVWLGEALGARQLAGIAVLIAGVMAMTTMTKPSRKAASPRSPSTR